MLDILPLGDPRLRQISALVGPADQDLTTHIADLSYALTTFQSSHGWGRAVALPQLGVAKRIIAFDFGAGPVFAINPVIEWTSPEMFEVWDDCMCLPEIAVRVQRHRSVSMTYLDSNMQPARLSRVPEDISELIQHEVDHLDGILLTDRMLPAWGVIARHAREYAQPTIASVDYDLTG